MTKFGFIQCNHPDGTVEGFGLSAETIEFEDGMMWVEKAPLMLHSMSTAVAQRLYHMSRTVTYAEEKYAHRDYPKGSVLIARKYINVQSFSIVLPEQPNYHYQIVVAIPTFPSWFNRALLAPMPESWLNQLLIFSER